MHIKSILYAFILTFVCIQIIARVHTNSEALPIPRLDGAEGRSPSGQWGAFGFGRVKPPNFPILGVGQREVRKKENTKENTYSI